MSRTRGAVAVVTLLLAATLLAPAGAAADTDPAVTIDYDGEAVTVANAETQVISGSADLAPGTSLTVRIKSTGDTEPRFLQTKSATVDRNGTWAAAFDLSQQSPGDTFAVTVKTGDSEVTADGEVVACDADCEDAQPTPVETVRIDTTDGRVVVNDTASQVISGSALAPSGTEVSLQLKSTDSEIRFFKAATAVVTEDGTWASAFNFTKVPAGSEFAVEATMDGEYVAESPGEVVSCAEDCRDTPPTDTPTPIPDSTPEETATPGGASVELVSQVVQTERNGTADIELRFDGTDTAGIVFGSESVGYTLEATVEDADGDGEATVRIDTGEAGSDGRTVTVSDGDEVTVDAETELPNSLAAGEYELKLFPGNGSAETPSDIGVVRINERSTTPEESTSTPNASLTPTGSPDDGSGMGMEIAVSGALVLGGGGLALLLRRG